MGSYKKSETVTDLDCLVRAGEGESGGGSSATGRGIILRVCYGMSGTNIHTEISSYARATECPRYHPARVLRNVRYCHTLRDHPMRVLRDVQHATEGQGAVSGTLSAYAHIMRYPVLPERMVLAIPCACYAMSGTDVAYGATSAHGRGQSRGCVSSAICLRACYAVSGTDLAYDGTILCYLPTLVPCGAQY
eukprot:2379522-Rhodomonas_salina.3